MVEDGHYPELTRLLQSLVAQGKSYQKDYDEIRRSESSTHLVDVCVVLRGPGSYASRVCVCMCVNDAGKKLAAKQEQEQRRALAVAATAQDEENDDEEAAPAHKKGKNKGKQQQQPKQEQEEEDEGEEEDGSDVEDLMPPAEVPTKTLGDLVKEAKRLGIKLEGLHGLEEEEVKAGEGEEGEGEDDGSVEIDGDVKGMEEDEGASGSEEEEVEEGMVVDDVKGDLEAGACALPAHLPCVFPAPSHT